MAEQFEAVQDQHILRLTFGAPGVRKLMEEAWFAALQEHLRQAQANSVVRVVLLAAQGDAFCSGADLKALAAGRLFPGGYAQSALARLLMRLTDFDKPIVAAVHGAAIGGGSTLLLHCDFVYAAEGTLFQLPIPRLGLVPEFGSSYLLALLAAPFDADKAQRAGIVSEVVPAPQLLEPAQATAQALLALPPGPLRASKRLLQAGHRRALEEAQAAEGRALEASVARPNCAKPWTPSRPSGRRIFRVFAEPRRRSACTVFLRLHHQG